MTTSECLRSSTRVLHARPCFDRGCHSNPSANHGQCLCGRPLHLFSFSLHTNFRSRTKYLRPCRLIKKIIIFDSSKCSFKLINKQGCLVHGNKRCCFSVPCSLFYFPTLQAYCNLFDRRGTLLKSYDATKKK